MKLFEIDCGAIYWVAAVDGRQAYRLWLKSMRDEGLGEDEIVEEIEDHTCAPIDRAARPNLVLKGDGDPDRPMWDVFDELTEQQVVGCSEWP